jgi:peptide deformylase
MDIVVPKEYQSLWRFDETRPIVKYPAEVLRKVALPIEKVNKKTRALIERMEHALKIANGVGVAAPQLGESLRVILIAPDGRKPTVLINPEIIHAEGEALGQEGCLSLPGLYGDVQRHTRVAVRAMNKEGNSFRVDLEGMSARIVEHEIDHLNGVLFIDKADPATLHWEWPSHEEIAG